MVANMLRCGQATRRVSDVAALASTAKLQSNVRWPRYPFGIHPEASFYSPTPQELEVVARCFPNDEPGNPSWIRIEDALLAAGQTKTELREATAVTLIRWLAESLTKAKPLKKPPTAPKRGRPKGRLQHDATKDQRLNEAWKSGRYTSKEGVDDEFKEPHGTTHNAVERHRKRVKATRNKLGGKDVSSE